MVYTESTEAQKNLSQLNLLSWKQRQAIIKYINKLNIFFQNVRYNYLLLETILETIQDIYNIILIQEPP